MMSDDYDSSEVYWLLKSPCTINISKIEICTSHNRKMWHVLTKPSSNWNQFHQQRMLFCNRMPDALLFKSKYGGSRFFPFKTFYPLYFGFNKISNTTEPKWSTKPVASGWKPSKLWLRAAVNRATFPSNVRPFKTIWSAASLCRCGIADSVIEIWSFRNFGKKFCPR